MINKEELQTKIETCVNNIVDTLPDEDTLEISRGYQFSLDDRKGIVVRITVSKI